MGQDPIGLSLVPPMVALNKVLPERIVPLALLLFKYAIVSIVKLYLKHNTIPAIIIIIEFLLTKRSA